MLLIKCPQCQASYRLAESLYRRKAAGYGVVITCRRCKTQIHVDEGSLPPPAGTADQSAPETPDEEVMAGTAPYSDQEPVTPNRAVRTSGTPTPSLTTANVGLPPADPSDPYDDTTDAAVTALPNVAPKPVAPPRPLGIPRPGATAPRVSAAAPRVGAAAPRRQGTLLGIAPPAHALTPAAPTVKPKAPPAPAEDWKPKLVALSPGLLGVQTATHGATHGAPPGAKAPPAPPHLHHPPPPPPPPVPDEEAAPDSAVPLSAGSVELLDSKPPDSVVPLDSADYSTAPETAPPAPPPVPPPLEDDEKTIVRNPVEETPLAVRAKRLPQPPPARAAEAKAPDVKEDEKPRRRQASGDLTDDFLSSDLSFDARASAPALAPPDAGALARAPVSNRPAAAQPSKTPSTKAPTSKSATAEKKGSGRGIAILLVMAAFGGAGYVLQHRAMRPEAAKAEQNPAVNAPPAETAPAPAETAPPAPTDTVANAPPEPSAAAPEAPAVAATAPATATATAPVGASTSTSKPAKTSARPVAAPAEPAEKVATTPTAKPSATSAPTSTAPIEPRGAAGTDPFDVAAARAALDASAAQASGCRKEGDPSGVAVVTITFSQTGRVTTANISGPPFQATPTGGCIASTMRKTRVPAFAGEMVTVRKTITVQ